MSRGFHAELDALDRAFCQAAQLVARSLASLMDASEPVRSDAVNRMVEEVHTRCQALEERGHTLLARQAPVSGDLRRLIAIQRLLTNIERAARHTRHVLDRLGGVDLPTLPPDLRSRLEDMGRRAAEVFQGGLDAWIRGDALAVIDLELLDREVDALQLRLLEAAGHSDRIHGEIRLALGLSARHYERIADHGVALARDTAFVVTGDRVTT